MLKSHSFNKKNDFIAGWYIDDLNLCQEIIDYQYIAQDRQPGKIGINSTSHLHNIDESVKKSFDCCLNKNEKLLNRYLNQLNLVVQEYIKKYPMCSDATGHWTIVSPVNIQHYEPKGGYFNWHSERVNANPGNTNRHLVFMTYLNTVEDAGETEFYHQKLKVKPKKGLTLIWPADWTFLHRGIASSTQDKCIVTGWFDFI
jgi:prolyl 4-hydroxylase